MKMQWNGSFSAGFLVLTRRFRGPTLQRAIETAVPDPEPHGAHPGLAPGLLRASFQVVLLMITYNICCNYVCSICI